MTVDIIVGAPYNTDSQEVDMEYGTCPVCNGSGRVPAGNMPYKTGTAGYHKDTDTLPCQNCGGQTMSLHGTGQVPLRKDGTPCVHEYEGHNAGRCYTKFYCKHCSHSYGIDSGD